MASPSPPSAALVRTARSEIERIERALTVIEQRRSALRAQLAELDTEVEGYVRRRTLLEELAQVEQATPTGVASTSSPSRVRRAIKGRELRRVAGQLLWDTNGESQIHYREWFERVLADGYAVGGKDPLASFLTNIRDSPAVVRGTRQGYYRLDSGSLARVTQQLGETEAEFADVEHSVERLYEDDPKHESINGLREHRDHLKQRIKALETDLDELSYVFGEGSHEPSRGTPPARSLRVA
jgi:chromosome segregation ATPase